ncbi:MAG: MBL fold metallo-hydrolase [Sphingomonadales bacterium]|nr:MBL fold metallo-hydrolase [Sphingomonadales bacterium]
MKLVCRDWPWKVTGPVAVGDVISANQVVMEVETDKAVFDLPCPHAGKVAKIHVKPGQSVPIGAVLLTHFHSDHIDGMGEFSIVWRVLVPNAWPARPPSRSDDRRRRHEGGLEAGVQFRVTERDAIRPRRKRRGSDR